MSTNPQLLKAIKSARTGADVVVKDIRARKDYSKKVALQTAVTALNTYSQNLMNAEFAPTLTDTEKASLRSEAETINTEVLAELMNDNIAMMNMGQLNTNRTIEPSTAKKNNENIAKEQGNNSSLISLLQVQAPAPAPAPAPSPAPAPAPPPAPVDVTLNSLTVSGAEKSESGLYYQFYNKDQTVRVLAKTTPNTPDAWAKIDWHGGSLDFSGAANVRAVPLNTLTSPGTPVTITATVNGKSLSVQVAVVPNLMSLEVTGATSDGNGAWRVEGDAPVTVCATTSPDTSEAFQFINWEGGKADTGKGNNVRLVDPSEITSDSQGLPVSAAIKVS